MSGNAALMAEFDKVRPPYNINVLTQATAEFVLEHVEVLDAQAATLRGERSTLASTLAKLPGVDVFPSAANFLLLRVTSMERTADQVFAALLQHKVLIKNVGKMHPLLENCLRVTVSTPEENAIFLDAFQASLASSS
jgi:histidinol-phosphate aminotransferase